MPNSKNEVVYTYYDEDGNRIGAGLLPAGTKTEDIVGKKVYEAEGGTWKIRDNDTVPAKVSLDESTGKITVQAPSTALKNENFKSNISSTLKELSAAYKENKNQKFNVVDKDGNNKEKSVNDIINDLNAPARTSDGSYNPNSIGYMAASAEAIERQKEGHRKNGIELDDDLIIKMNAIAVGPDVKDNTLQLISNLPEAAWLRNVDTYDKETGMAQYKDIMENAYNKEKTSSEDMIKLWAALEDYFAKGDYSDKEEYVRNVATARFLDATQPNMSWIRDVVENVKGLLDGIGGFSTELGTAGVVAVESLGRAVLGLDDEYMDTYGTDYSGTYIRRGGNQFATDMPLEKVDAKIGKIVFDENGVPTYQEEKIAGSIENPRTFGEYLRAVFKENQAVIRKDMEYLHSSQAAWDAVGYAITNMAALISAGNVLSDMFTVGAGAIATKVTSSIMAPVAETATALYASGSAIGYGTTAIEAASIVSGMKTIYDIATVTGQAGQLLNFIGRAVSSAKSTELIIGVVGESIAEAVVGDPDRLVEVLNSNEIDGETKDYLITTYIGNALGWGVGLGVGKFLTKAGETTRGRAISANWSRRIFKVQNAVGDAFDRALLTIRRVEGDDLAEKIQSLYDKGGKYAKKQANAMSANAMLRQMRAAIADSDAISLSGKSSDEVNKALSEIESKILQLQNAENALTSMQRQGMDIVQGWLKDSGRGIKDVTENFYSKAGELADLEKNAGDLFKPTKGAVSDLTSGKTLHLFSQTTTNYIKATEKIDYIDAYIKKYEHAKDVTKEILANVEAYKKEIPELKEMIDAFVDNANDELKLAADNFIDADRKWWNRFEDLRSDLGLTDYDELKWFRGSKLWGTNGELYARTSRKADLSEYVVKHRDGAANVKTFDVYENYMAGATGDFADPMGEMQIALYDAGNKRAYRSFTRSYDAITGALVSKVSGEETALYQKMKKGLQKAYERSSKEFLGGMAENLKTGEGGIEDVAKLLQKKNEQLGEAAKARASVYTTTQKMKGANNTVDASNASRFIPMLNAEDTTDLWDQFYDVSVRELLEDGGDYVPKETKRFIRSKAKELGLNVPNDASTVEVYDAVNRQLANYSPAEKIRPYDVDSMFENQVKRSILKRNENVLNDTRVQEYLSEQRRLAYEASAETFLAERTYEYKQLAEQYNVTVAELDMAGRNTIENYIGRMTKKGTAQRKAIDELCAYYGLEGDENAVRYFALSAFMDNKASYEKELGESIKAAIESDHNWTTKEVKKVTGTLVKGISSGIEEEYHNAYLIVKEINPEAVHETTEKLTKDIDRIADEIESAKANQYTGEKNIIAMRNMEGKVEYYQADPLLARLVNFQYSAEKLNGLTQAIYNANYLWTKLFRLGTTAINLKSMISQSFRDPINMFIGGGAYRTMQQSMDDIADVAGDDIVAYLKANEPEALARLEKRAAQTGESVTKLAVEREIEIGKALSPASTETNMYKSLSTAKRARFNGAVDIYDDTKGDKFVRGISKVEDALGKGNEWRETTLRNLSYSNGLSRALKRGYSLDQARTYATFIMNEATTNFSRMTNHLVSLKDTVPYFGSAINGSKSFFRLLSMDPVGVVGRLTGGLIIPAMALTTYSLLDEENRKVYKNIPEYQKEDALVFVVGGQVISIPIPQELGSFVAPFRQTIESMYGVSTNTFAQFAWHDILGFSPVDLTGFADLDFAKLEQSSPGFLDRIGRGITKMWSQLAPAPLKSGLEIVTGVDPYTGKAIDKSYLDYDEDGNPIMRDYKSGQIAKALNDMFHSWGLNSSAPVIQNILANIFGQASVDITDFLVSLCAAVPNGGIDWTVDAEKLRTGEGYNPFYVLEQRVTGPLTVEAYDEAQSAWKTEVAKLYNMKSEILKSDAWNEYLEAKRSTDDPEKLKNINSSKKDLVEDYFNTVKNVVTNLQANYGEQFTAAKYATVLSLMTMNEQTLDAGSYGKYLNTEEFKTARAQAIQTMIDIGFPSASTADILGKFVTRSNGNIEVMTYSPLAILQLDDTYGANIYSQSNKQHYAVIRNLINDNGIYALREKYYADVDKAYDAKDYKEVERIVNDYNEKVIKVIAPYIEQYGAESVLQGDVMDYLEDYIMVPSSAMGKGKYYSSSTGLNKQQGYARNYIKSIFGYGKNKLNGNK